MFRRLRRLAIEVFLGGDRAARSIGVSVGKDCRILTRRFGSEPWLVEIGDRVTVSGGVVIMTHDGASSLARDERGRRYQFGRVRIGSDVFIGANALIMPGVDIGDRVIVGAGSVVTKSVPSGYVVAGNPAKVITTFAAWERKVLADAPAAEEMVGDSLEERVAAVLPASFRPTVRPD